MRLRRVETLDILGQNREIHLPAGQYAGVMLRFHGTAAEGETPILADFGTILHRFRGRAIMNARAAEFWAYGNLRGGRPEAVTGAGEDFAFTVILPYRYGALSTENGDDNLLNVRPNEAQISIPAVGDDIFDSCFVDVCVLEDVGAARYIPQIFSQAYEYTGQDRIKLSAPNLRHLLIEEPKDANGNPAAAFAVSMLMTRDGRVMFEGAWAQFVALTDIDSFIEVGAADTGYAMPDFGNRNPATWAGGRYELQIIGVTAESVSHIVEFGAEPVSDAEFAAVNMEQSSDLAAQKASSPLPPSDTTAPVINQKAISAPVTVTVTIPPTREAQAMTEAGVPVFPIRAPVSKRPSSRTAF